MRNIQKYICCCADGNTLLTVFRAPTVGRNETAENHFRFIYLLKKLPHLPPDGLSGSRSSCIAYYKFKTIIFKWEYSHWLRHTPYNFQLCSKRCLAAQRHPLPPVTWNAELDVQYKGSACIGWATRRSVTHLVCCWRYGDATHQLQWGGEERAVSSTKGLKTIYSNAHLRVDAYNMCNKTIRKFWWKFCTQNRRILPLVTI